MQWYYVDMNQRAGPVDDAELARLAAGGRITGSTLVWNADLPDWQPYETVAAGDASGQMPVMRACQECGALVDASGMVQFSGANICAACKPVFLMRLREGAFVPPTIYGGFWIRGFAQLLDQAVLGAAQGAVQWIIILLSSEDPFIAGALGMGAGLLYLLGWLVYETWFVGRYGATPGKMALGLRIIVSDGSRVSYARALGRIFAEMLSAWLLYVGYLMAAFDKEKRALHDHICDTRVIRT